MEGSKLNKYKVIEAKNYKKMSLQEIANTPPIPRLRSCYKFYKKTCPVCKQNFETIIKSKITCSKKCQAIKKRVYNSKYIRKKRNLNKHYEPCVICGYGLTTDIHHEAKKTYVLCPNHHALISRGIKTLDELFKDKTCGKLNLR